MTFNIIQYMTDHPLILVVYALLVGFIIGGGMKNRKIKKFGYVLERKIEKHAPSIIVALIGGSFYFSLYIIYCIPIGALEASFWFKLPFYVCASLLSYFFTIRIFKLIVKESENTNEVL